MDGIDPALDDLGTASWVEVDPDAGDTIEYYWSEAATNPSNPVLDSVNSFAPGA